MVNELIEVCLADAIKGGVFLGVQGTQKTYNELFPLIKKGQ